MSSDEIQAPALSSTAVRRLQLILQTELIGGDAPTFDLRGLNSEDLRLIHDTHAMLWFIKDWLGQRTGRWSVQGLEPYELQDPPESPASCLVLTDNHHGGTPRAFTLSAGTRTALTWHVQLTGSQLIRQRAGYLAGRVQVLKVAAADNVAVIARQAAQHIGDLLEVTQPGPDQRELALAALAEQPSLEQCAMVCRILGVNFPKILAQACLELL